MRNNHVFHDFWHCGYAQAEQRCRQTGRPARAATAALLHHSRGKKNLVGALVSLVISGAAHLRVAVCRTLRKWGG